MFARNYYDPTHPHHYPIHNYSDSSTVSVAYCDSYQATPGYKLNRNVLVKYALLALADRELLSGRRVAKSEFASESDPGPEKTYTYQVYGEDINKKYGNQVMFANQRELDTLVRFLEGQVGKERMHTFHRFVDPNKPDDVERTAKEWLAKWRNGEGWPLD